MNIQLYENDKGSVVEKYGRSEIVDYIVDKGQLRLETLSSYTQYLAQKPPEGNKPIEVIQVEDETTHDINVVMGKNINYA